MYSKQEASAIKRKFWTSFGQYMKPVRSASGETTNWLNYKTGVRDIFFRLDAGRSFASVSIEIKHKDEYTRSSFMQKFASLKNMFEGFAGKDWKWEEHAVDEHGANLSRISKTVSGLNIFNEADWPGLISFLKPGIMALDQFWQEARDVFDSV